MEIVFLGIVLLVMVFLFIKRVSVIKYEITFDDAIKSIVDNKNFFYREAFLENDEGNVIRGRLIFGKTGVFLINAYEDLTGNIYGDDDKLYWTQVLEHRKLNIINPINDFKNFSNEFKIKYSRDFSNLKIYFVHCFSKKARIKMKSKYNIIYLSEFKDTIENYKEEIFSDEELKFLVEIFN